MSNPSIDKKIDSWKEKQLDLSRRNNMVDFSATKTKSLPTKHTKWPTIAAQLAEKNNLYVWKPDSQPEEIEESQTASEGSDFQWIDQDVVNKGQEPAEDKTNPTGGEKIAAGDSEISRPDTELISIRDSEETESSLYNISLNHRKYLQEKGVDSLYLALGMLEWYSVDYSDTKLRSPLFLASVSIERETVSNQDRHDYVIKSNDKIIINPALRKKLNSEHDLNLPNDENFDLTNLNAVASKFSDEISGFSRWEITNEVILGIFDFANLGLYNDLEENRERIKNNPIVKAIHGDQTDLNRGTGNVTDAEDLDQAIPPTDTFQVLEADSSQQEAIEAAKSGVSFVLQGPPGTGKSQTIANIIAEKMADDETILFVSEKQAALDVVKNRLEDVGLGRFCLPAHGKKANKDEVLSSLERELNAPEIKRAEARPAEMGKLRKRRAEINDYGDLLLSEYGAAQISAYEAHGILANLKEAPLPSWQPPEPFSVTKNELETATNQLRQLSAFQEQLSAYGSHPWSHLKITSWQLDTEEKMRSSLQAQQELLNKFNRYSKILESNLGLTLTSVTELEDSILPVLSHIESAPDVDWSPKWFDPSFYRQQEQVEKLITIHDSRRELRDGLLENYERSFLEESGKELNTELSEYGILRYISPSYRRLKKRMLNHATDGYSPDQSELQADAQQLMEYQSLASRQRKYADLIDKLGHLYDGEDTDWQLILDVQAWISEIADSQTFDLQDVQSFLTEGQNDIEELLHSGRGLAEKWTKASEFFKQAIDTSSVTTNNGQPLYDAPFEETYRTLSALESQISELKDWIQFTQALTDVQDTIAGEYIGAFVDEDINAEHLVEGFKKGFYTGLLNKIYRQTELGQFNSSQHEKVLQQFRKLDKKQQELDKVEIQHRVTSRRPSIDLEHASSSQQVVLRREIEKQRRRKPLRELFDEAGEMITRLKPCFMMSPLSVAQNLKADSIQFDCVIFDEASQIMPQDAISSIIRADQAIIAGDTKQLPPTKFFDADVKAGDDVREELESILEEAAAVLPEQFLRWHYRSRTDELIEFSNRKYYSSRLNTFPENNPDVKTGVDFEFVEDGIYDRGGSRQNLPEARRIVDQIEKLASTHPEKSVGVVAFSQAQERAIRDIIEERRSSNPTLDSFVDETDALEGFFVKNLESVQGDERDIMLFSVGYGPDQKGKITMNFGPLNNDGGERRLNVAVTRSRERVIVFSSLQPGDIDLSRTDARGVQDFKHYLEYAKKGERALLRSDKSTETLEFDSDFEEAVYTALEDEGHNVETQIQSSGYSIDLAIRHPEKPGKYLLGIECDGAAYHSSKTARDRDRTRQMILEDLGWTIHRIWSPDWASDQQNEIEAINNKISTILENEDRDSSRSEIESSANITVAEKEPEPVEEAEIDGGQMQFQEYEPIRPSQRRDRDFDEIPNRTLRDELASLVEQHGPIERGEAFKKLVSQWQFSRVGKNMRQSLTGITTHLDGSRIILSDGFLWPLQLDEVPVRINTDEESRSVDEIPIEELAKAAYIILENGIAMDREDLILETARQFGWQRSGKNIRKRIDNAVDYLITIGAAKEEDQLNASGIDIDDRILSEVYN